MTKRAFIDAPVDPPKKKKLMLVETVDEEGGEAFLYNAPWSRETGRSQEEAIVLNESSSSSDDFFDSDVDPWMAFAAILSLFFSTTALNYAYVDRDSPFFLYPDSQVEVGQSSSSSSSSSSDSSGGGEDEEEEAAMVPYLGMEMLAKLLVVDDSQPAPSKSSPFFIYGDMFEDLAPSGEESTSSHGPGGNLLGSAVRFLFDLLNRTGPAFPGAATDDDDDEAAPLSSTKASPFFIYGDAFEDLAPTAKKASNSQPALRFLSDLLNRTGPAFPGAAEDDEEPSTSSFNEAALNETLCNIFHLPVTAIKFLFSPFKPHREAPLTKLHKIKKNASSENLSSEDIASIAGKKIWGPRTSRSVRLRNAL